MCLIIVKPPNVTIPHAELVRGFSSNGDGAGLMYSKDGVLFIIKDIFDSFINFKKIYDEAVKISNNGPIVVHFRIATSGQKDKLNCHPFCVNEKLGLAHNGFFSEMSSRAEPLSDTALFSQLLGSLPENFIEEEPLLFLVQDFIKEERSKVVFMSNLGKFTIVNELGGDWKKGCWYSNKGFEVSSSFHVKTVCDFCHKEQLSYTDINYHWVSATLTRICDSCQEKILTLSKLCPECGLELDIDSVCLGCNIIYSEKDLILQFLEKHPAMSNIVPYGFSYEGGED